MHNGNLILELVAIKRHWPRSRPSACLVEEPQTGDNAGFPSYRDGLPILAAASGLILALAMPKPGVWALSWVGLVPLFLALRGAAPSRAALCGLVSGLVYFGVILFWVSLFGYLPWALLAAIQAAAMAAFAVAARFLQPTRIGWLGYVATPAAWTTLQWVRSLGPYAFTWGSFAHTQAANLPVAQIASLTGPWGIDFLVCLVNLALAGLIAPNGSRRYAPAGVAVGLIAVCAGFGLANLSTQPSAKQSVKVAVIQARLVTNLQEAMAADPDFPARAFEAYASMSLRAATARPDVIVWPETALGARIEDPGWGWYIARLAEASRADYLVGGYDPSEHGDYNAVHLYDSRGRKSGVYRKVRLVPFGEFVPLRSLLPIARRYGVRDEDVRPARRHVLLRSSIGQIGVSICFESLFPQVARSETRHGAVALFVLTNDSWFERTQAARQHAMMSTLRAIENGRWLVRCAATGISAVIDPRGRTVEEIGLYRSRTINARIGTLEGLTPYARLGDYFAYACALCTLVCLIGLRRRRR